MNPIIHDIAAILTISTVTLTFIHWVAGKARPKLRRRIVLFLRKLRDDINANER